MIHCVRYYLYVRTTQQRHDDAWIALEREVETAKNHKNANNHKKFVVRRLVLRDPPAIVVIVKECVAFFIIVTIFALLLEIVLGHIHSMLDG